MKPRVLVRSKVFCLCLVLWSLACAAQQPGPLLWSFETGAQIGSSPALGPEGNIYIGSGARQASQYSTAGAFYCVTPSGATNWVFRPGVPITASPALGPDGTIHVACDNGNLYALTPAGATNWVFRTGAQYLSTPAVGVDGTVYVAAAASYSGTKLYAVSSRGTTNWVFRMGAMGLTAPESTQFPSPAIGRDGTIYIGSLDAHVYAVSPSGKTNWVFALGNSNPTYSSPAIGVDGTVYIGSDLGQVFALTPAGTRKWVYTASYIVESSAVLDASGSTLYIGSLGQNMFALSSSTGAKLWSNPIGSVSSSAAVGADGTLYFTMLNPGAICALSPSGQTKWTYPLPGYAFSSPVLGSNGTLYVGGTTKLYAFSGTNALAGTPWPMFRREIQHQARAVQCGLSAPRSLPDGNVALGLTVETNRAYTVEVSSDLRSWGVLTNVSSFTWHTEVLDLDATNFARHYYRLRTP